MAFTVTKRESVHTGNQRFASMCVVITGLWVPSFPGKTGSAVCLRSNGKRGNKVLWGGFKLLSAFVCHWNSGCSETNKQTKSEVFCVFLRPRRRIILLFYVIPTSWHECVNKGNRRGHTDTEMSSFWITLLMTVNKQAIFQWFLRPCV